MSEIDYSLYLVTDEPDHYATGLLDGVAAAVAGGVTVVQYRATTGSKGELYRTALALRDLLRPRGVPLVINDHLDLAQAVGAEGVHLGQNDLPVAVARAILGKRTLLGLSITASNQLTGFDADAVDYLGIGPVFPTVSKDDAAPALGLEGLSAMTACSRHPVVAIGGISVERAPSVFATGVAGIAVISALSRASDPAAVARQLRTFSKTPI